MNLKIQLVILLILIISFLLLCRQVKKRTLDLKYTLAWFVLVLALIVIDVFPVIITSVSSLVGITTPSNMLFLFGYVLLIVIIYTLTAAISKLSDNVRSMAQKIALLEKELDEYKKSKDE